MPKNCIHHLSIFSPGRWIRVYYNDNNKESYLLSLPWLFWNKNMFRLVQFVNTLTTSYWYISGAQYKIQDVSIFSHRSIYQAFQGFLLTHWRLLRPDCLFLVSSTVSMLSHRGEFNKELETRQTRLIQKPTYLNGCAFGRRQISE